MADETTKDAPPKSSQSDADILDQARKDYKACSEADSNSQNRINAVADLKFLEGGENQWDAIAVTSRKNDGRPIITVNDLPAILHQVTNDQRMNMSAIKVHPVGEGADIESAKIRQGVIRHIEYDSNAAVARATAVNSAAAVGFGYYRVITEYEYASTDQKIKIQRISNALSVRIDPLSVEADGSDMKFAFVELKMSKEAFKREYPKAEAGSSDIWQGDSSYAGWLTDTEVLVCDYYRIETEPAEIVRLSNGESGFKEDLVPPGGLPEGLTVVKTRTGERCRIMLYKITGVDILDRTEIMCPWIPVFPVYGDEINIEGRVVRAGIIRHAKGPAQMFNVCMSSATEEVAERNRTPVIGAIGQFDTDRAKWEQIGARKFPFAEYDPVSHDGHLVPAPQRQPPADIPSGFLALSAQAQDNKKKVTGLYNASLGAKGTATSGIQEQAQQKEGDVANFHYADGLNRTMLHEGRCINCMISHYLNGQQIVKIMGVEGDISHVEINVPNVEQKPDEKGEIRALLKDMTCADYAVTISTGPGFSTMRQENADFFAKAMTAAKDPATAAIVTYLAIKNNDAPGADEATAMIKTTLPPAAAAVLDQAGAKDKPKQPDIMTPKGPLPVDKVPQVLQMLEGQLQQQGEQLKQADAAKQQAEASRQQAEVLKQQNLAADAALAPKRMEAETLKNQAALASAQAAGVAAQADLERAQAEAQDAAVARMRPPAVEPIEDPQVTLLTAQAAAASAEAARITAQANLIKAQVEQQLAPVRADTEMRKAATEQASAGQEQAAMEAERLSAEAERLEAAKPPAPTLDEIAAMMLKLRPPLPASIAIRAPSGGVYTVDLAGMGTLQ